jgi:porphobilinogen deaminase
MRIFFGVSALLAFFAAAPAMAQGTAAQKAACEDDAYRFCQAQIPDAIAIENCLRANAGGLSGGCRAEMGLPAESAGKKHKR